MQLIQVNYDANDDVYVLMIQGDNGQPIVLKFSRALYSFVGPEGDDLVIHLPEVLSGDGMANWRLLEGMHPMVRPNVKQAQAPDADDDEEWWLNVTIGGA